MLLPASGGAAAYAALQRATKESTGPWQAEGFYLGRIIDVYDGDTCRLAVLAPCLQGGPPAVRFLRIRVLGYDAPEMKKDHRPYGLEVKAVLSGLVLGRLVVAYVPVPREDAAHGYPVPDRSDPYGRTLAHLFVAPAPSSVPPGASRSGRSGGGGAAARGGASCCGCWPGRSGRPGRASSEPPAGEHQEGGGPFPHPGSTPASEVMVRGRPVALPATYDVPPEIRGGFAPLGELLWVNGWMVGHARVKPYDGKAARAGYTDAELAHGYPCPEPALVGAAVEEEPPLSAPGPEEPPTLGPSSQGAAA